MKRILKISILLLLLYFTYADWQNRIYNGVPAKPGVFPFTCALFFGLNGSTVPVCGACIISPFYIMTSARCVPSTRQVGGGYNYYAVAGINYLDQLDNAQIRKVVNITIHPDFVMQNTLRSDDIAMLKLDAPLNFHEAVQPLYLAPPDDVLIPGETVFLTGWGMIGSDVRPHFPVNDLRFMNTTILSNNDCRNQLKNYTDPTLITEKHLCTAVEKNLPQQGCMFDLGMPLVKFDSVLGYIVIGIATWTVLPCGYPPNPTVYTNLSYYTDFIYGTASNV